MAEAEHFSGKIAQKVIIEWQGKVLLARNSFDKNLGVWDLPGGRLHVGENPAAGAAREIKEELGIDVEMIRIVHAEQFVHTRSGQTHFMLAWAARPVGEPTIDMDPKEVEEYIWVAKEGLSNCKVFDNCERALEAYFGVK